MPEQLSLFPQISVEYGQVFPDRAEHRIQRLPAHLRLIKRHRKRRLISPLFTEHRHLRLNMIQRKSHRVLYLFVSRKLRLISIFPHFPVRTVGHIPDLGQRDFPVPVRYRNRGCQIRRQLAPRRAARHVHRRNHLLNFIAEKMLCLLFVFFEQKGKTSHQLTLRGDRLHIRNRRQELLHGRLRRRGFCEQTTESGLLRHNIPVLRVHRLTQIQIYPNPVRQPHHLVPGQQKRLHIRRLIHVPALTRLCGERVNRPFQRGKICLIAGIVQSLINFIQ